MVRLLKSIWSFLSFLYCVPVANMCICSFLSFYPSEVIESL